MLQRMQRSVQGCNPVGAQHPLTLTDPSLYLVPVPAAYNCRVGLRRTGSTPRSVGRWQLSVQAVFSRCRSSGGLAAAIRWGHERGSSSCSHRTHYQKGALPFPMGTPASVRRVTKAPASSALSAGLHAASSVNRHAPVIRACARPSNLRAVATEARTLFHRVPAFVATARRRRSFLRS